MPITFDQAQTSIAQLVKHFKTNLALYRAPHYKEAQARQEFIDKMFVYLGWDVYNEERAAPQYREVEVEPTQDVEGEKRAPDYVFRIGTERKFFVEAKKPGVSIKMDARPAYQVRRYAWSAKLPLSLLTDFEELAVYDCRMRPAAPSINSSNRPKASAAPPPSITRVTSRSSPCSCPRACRRSTRPACWSPARPSATAT